MGPLELSTCSISRGNIRESRISASLAKRQTEAPGGASGTLRCVRRPELLFVNSLQLAIDDFAREAIDRDMEPVALFTFDDKLRKLRRARGVTS
jgi:hypothetical protein